MSNAAALNRYLAGVEQRAFRMARYAVSDVDEAMDIVVRFADAVPPDRTA